jgi:outer membrane protein TolC
MAAGARSWWPLALLVALGLTLPATRSLADAVKLDDVIGDTLRDSLVLQRAKTKIDTARGEVMEAKSAFDWTTLAQTGWQRFIVPQSKNGFLTDTDMFVDAWRTTVGVSKQFSNGISMTPGVTTYITPGTTVGQALGYTETVPTINLTIPLDRGLGEANAGATERAAKAKLSGTRFDYDYTAQKTVHDVVQLFWRCLADAQQRMVMLEADQQQTDNERWLDAMVRRGQTEPATLQRAQALHTLSNRELDEANEGVLQCRRQLADAAGMSGSTMPEPIGELPHPERLGPAIERLQDGPLVSYALQNRRDLRALKAYVEAQRDLLKGAKDQLNPTVDVVLDPFQAYVRYTQSFGNNAAKGHIAEAMAAESDADIALRQDERAVGSDIANAVHGLKELWRGWPALVAARRKLEALVNSADRRVREGTADRDTLRNAQNELARAEHATIDARLKLAAILASLRLYTGAMVLERDTPQTLATEFSTLPQP